MIPSPGALLLVSLVAASCLAGGCTTDLTPAADPGLTPALPSQAVVAGTIDGDTIRIALPGGGTGTLRILGIDTPEMTPEGNDPGKFDGIRDRDLLSLWGGEAARYTRDRLGGQRVAISYDREAGTRDAYGRLLATITLPDGTDHGEDLVRRGLARVYTQETFSLKDRYLSAQDEAIGARRGLWGAHSPPDEGAGGIVIMDAHYNAEGDDNENLNGEYFTIRNQGSTPADLTSWEVRDSDGFVFVLPAVTLQPGSALTLFTGTGESTGDSVFMRSPVPVLNNGGDNLALYDREGNRISSFSWG